MLYTVFTLLIQVHAMSSAYEAAKKEANSSEVLYPTYTLHLRTLYTLMLL
jgi:hypothetical protein